MKDKQDIEKIFQDNRHGLDERPSDRAWNRLESRLDGAPSIQRRPRPAFRIMGMAAGVLFLVSMIALMSVLFQQNTNQTASKDALSLPVMEELEKFENEKGVYAIAVSFQKYLNQSPKTIAEGSGNKRLLSPTDAARSKSTDHIAQASKAKKAKKEIELSGNGSEEVILKNKITAAKSEVAEEITAPSSMPSRSETADVRVAVNQEDKTAEIEEAAAYADTEYAQTDYPSSKPNAQRSNAQSPPPPASAYDQAKDLNAESNAISYEADVRTTSATVGLEQFQWLIGQWNGPLGYGRQNIEQWEQADEFTIVGSGQLVINGDTTFTEGMKIQKIGDQLYYILALDDKQKEVRFKLRSIDPQFAIFETEEKRKPNQQLILEQHGLNNFSTTLQNVASEPLKDKQLQYLQNRNNVQLNNQSTRRMSRSY